MTLLKQSKFCTLGNYLCLHFFALGQHTTLLDKYKKKVKL